MSLRQTLSSCWSNIQHDLFPWLEERVGALGAVHQDLVKVLEMARVEAFVRHCHGAVGRPPAERAALARAFVAKAVFNLATTAMLIEYVKTDKILRRLCGWERANEIPSEATFSRAFAEFAASALPSKVHEALITRTHKDRLVGQYLARQHGDRGAGETGEAGRAGDAEIQARSPAQRRTAAAERPAPARATAGDEPRSDAGRVA